MGQCFTPCQYSHRSDWSTVRSRVPTHGPLQGETGPAELTARGAHLCGAAAVGAMVSGLVAALPARALSYDEMMAANQAKGPSIKGLVKRSAASSRARN